MEEERREIRFWFPKITVTGKLSLGKAANDTALCVAASVTSISGAIRFLEKWLEVLLVGFDCRDRTAQLV